MRNFKNIFLGGNVKNIKIIPFTFLVSLKGGASRSQSMTFRTNVLLILMPTGWGEP